MSAASVFPFRDASPHLRLPHHTPSHSSIVLAEVKEVNATIALCTQRTFPVMQRMAPMCFSASEKATHSLLLVVAKALTTKAGKTNFTSGEELRDGTDLIFGVSNLLIQEAGWRHPALTGVADRDRG